MCRPRPVRLARSFKENICPVEECSKVDNIRIIYDEQLKVLGPEGEASETSSRKDKERSTPFGELQYLMDLLHKGCGAKYDYKIRH